MVTGNFVVSRCKAAPVTRRGLSITDLADMARAFASQPRERTRRGGRHRGSAVPPRQNLEPVQGELLCSPETTEGAIK